MKTRILLPIILMAVLFTSCSDEGRMYIMEGESETTCYLVKEGRAVRVTIPGSFLESYRERRGVEGEELYMAIFPLNVASYSSSDEESYRDAKAVIDMLSESGGYPGELECFEECGKYLRKSALDTNMKRFSPSFDTLALIEDVMKCNECGYYTLPSLGGMEDVEEYLDIWSREILRKV